MRYEAVSPRKNNTKKSFCQLEGDQWRANGYKRASATLQRMGRYSKPARIDFYQIIFFVNRVTDSAQLKSVRGFGKSIREKIQVNTNPIP